MSSLKKQLVEEMKLAMKENKDLKVSAIRRVRAAIKNKEIEKRKELSDTEVAEILFQKVKKHQNSIAEYKKSGKTEQIKELKNEIEILSTYLPETIEDEEEKDLNQLVNG